MMETLYDSAVRLRSDCADLLTPSDERHYDMLLHAGEQWLVLADMLRLAAKENRLSDADAVLGIEFARSTAVNPSMRKSLEQQLIAYRRDRIAVA